MYKYNFNERLSKITKFDIIRICKILEMFQYSITFFILIILLVYILNHFYYIYLKMDNEIDKVQDRSNKNFILLISYLMLDTFIIIVSVFYIRKIVLLFPSLPHLYYPKFIPYTTIHFTINVALIFVLLTLLPEYKAKLEQLKLYLS